MKKVGVVILDYKNKRDTKLCIESFDGVDVEGIDVSLIVVNNDKSTHFEKKDFPSKHIIKIINNIVNSGFTGGNNVGIKEALAFDVDYILLLNNDTIVHKNFLKELIGILDSDEKIGVVAPKIYFAKGHEFHKDRYTQEELGHVFWYAGGITDWENVLGKHRGVDAVDIGQYDKIEETDFASGCCFLMRSTLVEQIGFFDQRYFLYYEDSDFNQRVKKKGYKIMYVPKSVIWHKNAGSTGGSGSSLQDYFISRNRLLFGITYAPVRAKLALLKEGIRLLHTGRPWQKKAVQDFFLHQFGKGSYPIAS